MVTILLSLLLVSISFILLYVKYVKRNTRHSQLGSRIPGPTPLPILGNVLLFAKEPYKCMEIACDKCIEWGFGPLRLWIFNDLLVFVAKADDAEVILGNMKIFKKAWHYSALHPFMGQGLLTSNDHNSWRTNRKTVTPVFHFGILKTFIPIFFEEASILVKKINPGEETEVPRLVGLCALDIICRTAMGVRLHCQSGKGKVFVEGIEQILKIAYTRALRMWLMNDFIFSLSSLKKPHDEACHDVLTFVEDIIKKKRKENSERKLNNSNNVENVVEDPGAFLDTILADESSGCAMSDRQLRDESMTLITGGQETTTTEITFALLMLALHQDIQSQVLEEIDSVFQGDKLRMPSFEDILQLHLLERVIKETMRLYPSLPVFGRTLDDDVDMNGYLLPRGCTVYIFAYGVHRDPKWYPDPNSFNPDNFLMERCRERPAFAYIPFSAGLRNCLGQKYALLQMKTLLSTVLRNYSLSPGGDIRRMEDVTIKFESTLKSAKPVKIIFTPR